MVVSSILAIWKLFKSRNSVENAYLYTVSHFLHYSNMSLSFFIHFMTNSLFRREFWSLFRFSRRNSGKIANVPIIRINHLKSTSSIDFVSFVF